MLHVMSWALSSRHAWCHRCWHCAGFGVVVAFIAPCMVSQALSSCRLRCCGCFHCAKHSVVGTVVGLHGVVVAVTMPRASHCRRARVVLRSWLWCGVVVVVAVIAWCHSCGHCCHIVMATSWPYVITICTKEEVSRKKKKKTMHTSRQ